MRKSLLLRKAEASGISLHLHYDGDGMDPESFLVERDLLAPLFDQQSNPLYRVQSYRIEAEFKDFNEALNRYYELVINWKGIETYVHPRIFKWDKKWVEGVPHPMSPTPTPGKS